MHRGRTWTQRQLIGLGTPADYNARLRDILAQGAHRGVADPVQLGVPRLRHGRGARRAARHLRRDGQHASRHMDRCLDGVDHRRHLDCALNDPSPFTLLAFVLAAAKRRGIPWTRDHRHVEPERLSLALRRQPHVLPPRAAGRAARARSTTSRSATGSVPQWNPMSVVGQHMQQARRDAGRGDGASRCRPRSSTPTTASRAAWDPDQFLPRFTFFFDISIIVLRGGREVPRRPAHLGAARARALRREGSALVALQVPRPDLGRRPHARAAAQQHRRASRCRRWPASSAACSRCTPTAYDEVLSVPTETARASPSRRRTSCSEEAHLTDVIDPLGGSYYVEALTDQMEAKIREVIARIDDGRRHVRARWRRGWRSGSAASRRWRSRQKVDVGRADGRRRQQVPRAGRGGDGARGARSRRRAGRCDAQHQARSSAFKAERAQAAGARARSTRSARAAESKDENVYEQVVEAA